MAARGWDRSALCPKSLEYFSNASCRLSRQMVIDSLKYSVHFFIFQKMIPFIVCNFGYVSLDELGRICGLPARNFDHRTPRTTFTASEDEPCSINIGINDS
ncbi:MAG: hypothetical protein ACRDRU_09000 [Pseudonocardiaceae bacterium]